MDLYDTFETLGSAPTATFGCTTPVEIVGPLKPKSVQYGITYDDDSRGRPMYHALPTVWLNFNKYRPDLPPWRNVVEFVLATKTETGDVVEVTFIDTDHNSTTTTGDLKTVNLVADSIREGVEGAVIQRDEVAEKRDMDRTTGVSDGTSFKVNGRLE